MTAFLKVIKVKKAAKYIIKQEGFYEKRETILVLRFRQYRGEIL